MADFATHGVMGAAETLGLVKLLALFGNYIVHPVAPMIIGFVVGSAPDTIDWAVWQLSRWHFLKFLHGKYPDRYGSIYLWFHYKMPTWLKVVLFPAGTHVTVDLLFHRKPAGISLEDWNTNKDGVRNWWPRWWWLDILLAAVFLTSVVLLLLWKLTPIGV